MILTAEQLSDIMPHCATERLAEYAALLSDAMTEFGINTVARAAYFLGQVCHESGSLQYWVEKADGHAYERRTDLGNVEPGDGAKYKGRGPLQLTGRANYLAAGEALGLPLEEQPGLVATPAVGFRASAWYWKTRGCSDTADMLNIEATTKKINGGLNGLEYRRSYTARAMTVLVKTALLA